MDLVLTVGQYNLISMVLNSFGVQLDGDVTGFPETKLPDKSRRSLTK